MTETVHTSFKGKRVVVVGSGYALTGPDDIGTASAVAFAAAGAEVAVVQFTQQAADKCVNVIRDAGGSAIALANDPREPAQIFEVAQRVEQDWPQVDVLVTSHFGTYVAGVEELTLDQWEETLRVNLTGVFVGTKAFLPLLRKGTDPSIVHVNSIDGILGNPNIPAYTASKGGVTTLTHVLAAELAAAGIRVNAIGRASSTAMPLPDAVLGPLNAVTPLGRPGDPAEYAAAVLFLASSAASYITGVTLPVDGGRMAVTPGTTSTPKKY